MFSCRELQSQEDAQQVADPQVMDRAVSDVLQERIRHLGQGDEFLFDSVRLQAGGLLKNAYTAQDYRPVWCSQERFMPRADTLIRFIEKARYYGLYPSSYHLGSLQELYRRALADSAGTGDRKSRLFWVQAELVFSDAFLLLAQHLHKGRMLPDSIHNQYDTLQVQERCVNAFGRVVNGFGLVEELELLEPAGEAYQSLRKALRGFLDTARLEPVYTYLRYPYKDSLQFVHDLVQRLRESGWMPAGTGLPDAGTLAAVLTRLQQSAGLTPDGKFGTQVVRYLNRTDPEIFKQVAINLDRYRLLPDQLPGRFIWVNLPSFSLRLWDMDTVRLESRVIVGKPITRTPLLSSHITDIVTYPQWTVPNSIIVKEMLPSLRKDPGYLAKKGYMLLTWQGEEVDPWLVDWSKYKTGIPYKVVQGSGDANALGILKFNFHNRYSVYLHDTNQRSLFRSDNRALSHGCVRVQAWEQLARYILQSDSVAAAGTARAAITDSVRVWMERKERRVVPVKTRFPVYFRYFTAEAREGKLLLYPDIYGEDALVRGNYPIEN